MAQKRPRSASLFGLRMRRAFFQSKHATRAASSRGLRGSFDFIWSFHFEAPCWVASPFSCKPCQVSPTGPCLTPSPWLDSSSSQVGSRRGCGGRQLGIFSRQHLGEVGIGFAELDLHLKSLLKELEMRCSVGFSVRERLIRYRLLSQKQHVQLQRQLRELQRLGNDLSL